MLRRQIAGQELARPSVSTLVDYAVTILEAGGSVRLMNSGGKGAGLIAEFHPGNSNLSSGGETEYPHETIRKPNLDGLRLGGITAYLADRNGCYQPIVITISEPCFSLWVISKRFNERWRAIVGEID
jgi:hypothetical protein